MIEENTHGKTLLKNSILTSFPMPLKHVKILNLFLLKKTESSFFLFLYDFKFKARIDLKTKHPNESIPTGSNVKKKPSDKNHVNHCAYFTNNYPVKVFNIIENGKLR